MGAHSPYVLSLDLGTSSLGWAVLDVVETPTQITPTGIRLTGVRIFEAGVEGDIEQGKDSSRAAERRLKRQPRRQQWRRQWRHRRLFEALQRAGLLPSSADSTSASRKQTLEQLDSELQTTHLTNGDHAAHQKLPYLLRDRASTAPVEPFELGRALYHLGQRRGYLSNRQSDTDDEEAGKVLTGIGELDQEKGSLTLGQHFARNVDPAVNRIRQRYTSRKQYHDEFEAIRQAQSAAHPAITVETWKVIERAIFYQRPLKSQKNLIGRCELEKERRRCPVALPIFQEFRVLQTVNHLTVVLPDRTRRPLTSDELKTLSGHLMSEAKISLAKAVKLLGLPKRTTFTAQGFGDDDIELIGHRTNAKLAPLFGPKWFTLSADEQTRIVYDVINYRKPEALGKRAQAVWGLSEQAAKDLSRIRLEPDFGRHSRQAIEKLVPLMRQGLPYATARKQAYPDSFKSADPLPDLPPVRDWNKDLKSPAVIRALTELRKVVNALIRKYGKPARIHIELARDLKNSRDRRQQLWKDSEDRRNRRDKAVKEMLEKFPGRTATQRDIDKWLLATECGWVCPYTGKPISHDALISDHPQFDIEHIYPRKYLDDSFGNKTLCDVTFNRHVKKDRLPFDALGGNPATWEAVLARVAAFVGPPKVVEGKARRFAAESVPNDFASRQLNDTRYNSRLAAEYLGLLYGGRSDLGQTQRVITPTGALTGMLRRVWGLNSILGDDEKNREDHRHHAIDAAVIGVIDQGLIQTAGAAAHEEYEAGSSRFLKRVPLPWDHFVPNVRDSIHAINVSHRVTHTLAGPLHAETNYSREISAADGSKEFHVRKELHKLTDKEILGDKIVDPVVRAAVQAKFAELTAARKNAKPFQLWGDASRRDAYPFMTAKDGRRIPILKVRLRTDAKPRKIGKGVRERRVASGKDSNFASMIYARVDKSGKETKWEHEIVTRLEAHERMAANHKKSGEKVLIPADGDNRRFEFSLMKNDCLLLTGPEGADVLYRVQKLSQNEIQLCEHYRSIIANDQRTPWNRISSIDSLRKRACRKVEVKSTGDLF